MTDREIQFFRKIDDVDSAIRAFLDTDTATNTENLVYSSLCPFVEPDAFPARLVHRTDAHTELTAVVRFAFLLMHYSDAFSHGVRTETGIL